MNDKTPIIRIKDTEHFIEWPDLMIEIAIETLIEADDGWLGFEVWDAAPWGTHEWLRSGLITTEDWEANGPEALRGWAEEARFNLTIDADD